MCLHVNCFALAFVTNVMMQDLIQTSKVSAERSQIVWQLAFDSLNQTTAFKGLVVVLSGLSAT